MNKFIISLIVGCGIIVCQSSPLTSAEGSALVQEQAQHNYNHHQDVIKNQGSSSPSSSGYNPDGSFGITFDNKNKEHRDRGYGYEKAYAYSRETAFFDFYDDKGALNAKDLVEKLGSASDKEENLLKNISS